MRCFVTFFLLTVFLILVAWCPAPLVLSCPSLHPHACPPNPYAGSTPAHHHQQQQQPAGQHFDPAMYELAIVVMGSYLAYLLAEVVGMSGIVALFFSGECMEGDDARVWEAGRVSYKVCF